MSARIYLNGDGIGSGTHVSIFLDRRCMTSDALFPRPFNKMVKFELHHLEDRQKDVVESIEVKSASDVYTGCPHFLPLKELDKRMGEFIRDDTAEFIITVNDNFICQETAIKPVAVVRPFFDLFKI